ncbi:hypothetical protein YC2023_067953 [Brassica napus]
MSRSLHLVKNIQINSIVDHLKEAPFLSSVTNSFSVFVLFGVQHVGDWKGLIVDKLIDETFFKWLNVLVWKSFESSSTPSKAKLKSLFNTKLKAKAQISTAQLANQAQVTEFLVNKGNGVKGLSETRIKALLDQYIQPLKIIIIHQGRAYIGWALYPISEVAPEPDPKKPNRNPNRSSKIRERVLNKERLDTRTRTDNTRTRMDIRR